MSYDRTGRRRGTGTTQGLSQNEVFAIIAVSILVAGLVSGGVFGWWIRGPIDERYFVPRWQYNELKDDFEDFQADYNDLQTKYNDLKDQFDELDEKYAELEDDFTNLQAKYDNLQAKYDNLQAKYDDLKSAYDKIVIERDSLLTQKGVWEIQRTELANKIKNLELKIKELEEELCPPEEFDIKITYPTNNKVFKFYSWQQFFIVADDVRGTWDGERSHDRFYILINDEDGYGGWTERFDPQCKIEFEDDGTWHAVSPVYITGDKSITKEKFRILLVEVSKRGEQYYKDYLEGGYYYGLPWYSGAKIWDEVVVFRQIR